MAQESLTKSLYKDSPKLDRDKDGKVSVNKGGKSSEKSTEADQITSGADGAVRDTTDRHAAERFEMRHKHIKEHVDMHTKHAHEHMRHKGDKKELHSRHESELAELHKSHEKAMKSLHERHNAELSGGTEEEEGKE